MNKIEYLAFDIRDCEEAREHNRALLREGVVGIRCTEVRDITDRERYMYQAWIPAASFVSSVEEYANGALNMYVRHGNMPEGRAFGFIRVRPESEEDMAQDHKPIVVEPFNPIKDLPKGD